MQRLATFLLILGVFLCGCEEVPTASTSSSGPSANRSSAPPPPPPSGADDESEPAVEDDGYEREVAAAGVGKKGRNYGGGVITEPVKQYFQASQRINFLNMKRAMDLFKASNGKLPQSHEEFMDKIIKANEIELPELPDGQRYIYDPKLGELMVEKPKP